MHVLTSACFQSSIDGVTTGAGAGAGRAQDELGQAVRHVGEHEPPVGVGDDLPPAALVRSSTVTPPPGAIHPSMRTRSGPSGVMVTIVVRLWTGERDRLDLGTAVDRRADQAVHALQLRDLGMQRVEGDPELEPLDQPGGHRVGGGPGGGDPLEQRDVLFVDAPSASVASSGHHASQCGSSDSCARSFARQRPRVGPMLPIGMPRASATAA